MGMIVNIDPPGPLVARQRQPYQSIARIGHCEYVLIISAFKRPWTATAAVSAGVGQAVVSGVSSY